MNKLNSQSELEENISFILNLCTTSETLIARHISALQLFNLVEKNIDLVTSTNLKELMANKLNEFKINIPSLIFYDNILGTSSKSEYANLYYSLNVCNKPKKIIKKLIKICPFTIYFIDKPTNQMFSIVANVINISRITIKYLKYTWKLYNFTKFIKVPVKNLFKIIDVTTRVQKHLLTTKTKEMVVEDLYKGAKSDSCGNIYTVPIDNYFSYASYIIDNKTYIGKIELVEYEIET